MGFACLRTICFSCEGCSWNTQSTRASPHGFAVGFNSKSVFYEDCNRFTAMAL